MLKAVLADAGGGAPLIYSLTTAITVTEPNLTVGDLEVNGVVRMRRPKEGISTPAVGVPKYYKAGTDGTILGYLTGQSGQPAGTLIATIYRTDDIDYTIRFSSDNSTGLPTQTPISVPVPADSQVRLFHTGNSRDTLQLFWLPHGVGALTEITPPAH